MRPNTVLAAWAPSGPAAWQLIRNGRPDGAAASPAATMRSSSMLVSVSSVSSRPSGSVRSPLRAARSGTLNPAVHTVAALGSTTPSLSTTSFQRTSVTVTDSSTPTPRRRSRLATERRPRGLSDGPSTGPQIRVTGRPSSASSEAVSMPVSPPPTTVIGAGSGRSASA